MQYEKFLGPVDAKRNERILFCTLYELAALLVETLHRLPTCDLQRSMLQICSNAESRGAQSRRTKRSRSTVLEDMTEKLRDGFRNVLTGAIVV